MLGEDGPRNDADDLWEHPSRRLAAIASCYQLHRFVFVARAGRDTGAMN